MGRSLLDNCICITICPFAGGRKAGQRSCSCDGVGLFMQEEAGPATAFLERHGIVHARAHCVSGCVIAMLWTCARRSKPGQQPVSCCDLGTAYYRWVGSAAGFLLSFGLGVRQSSRPEVSLVLLDEVAHVESWLSSSIRVPTWHFACGRKLSRLWHTRRA